MAEQLLLNEFKLTRGGARDELAATGAFVKFWKRHLRDSAAHTSEIILHLGAFL